MAANLADRVLGLGLSSVTLGLLVATEALSVVENLRRISPGHPLWERLGRALGQKSRSD